MAVRAGRCARCSALSGVCNLGFGMTSDLTIRRCGDLRDKQRGRRRLRMVCLKMGVKLVFFWLCLFCVLLYFLQRAEFIYYIHLAIALPDHTISTSTKQTRKGNRRLKPPPPIFQKEENIPSLPKWQRNRIKRRKKRTWKPPPPAQTPHQPLHTKVQQPTPPHPTTKSKPSKKKRIQKNNLTHPRKRNHNPRPTPGNRRTPNLHAPLPPLLNPQQSPRQTHKTLFLPLFLFLRSP